MAEDKSIDKGVDQELLENRILFLTSEINTEVATDFLKQMMVLQQRSLDDPIHVFINSEGGYVSDGLAIYDAIRTAKCPVYTYVQGEALSIAAVILIAGDKGHRYAFKHSSIMFHEYSQDPGDHRYHQHTIIMKKGHQDMDTLVSIIKKHTKLGNKKEIKKLLEKDKYYSAKEAKKYGIIDQIL